jgi:hypothetical protein
MCQQHPTAQFELFCEKLRQQLGEPEFLDAPLAAAAELLDRRLTPWSTCELTRLAWNAEDVHSALGAAVLLSLWNGARAR